MSDIKQQLDEPLLKKQLRAAIGRKKKLLAELMMKVETMRFSLMTVKAEYDRRIGMFCQQLEELDEQIFELRKLHDLLLKKIPITEARRLLAERERAQVEREQAREANTERGAHVFLSGHGNKLKPREHNELRKLWRRLAFRFHPDLVHNEEEKHHREEVMKRVNEAYSRADIIVLKAIDKEEMSVKEDLVDATMQELEQSLIDTESNLRRARQKLKAFKKLEWYKWEKLIEKARRENRDFYAQLEESNRRNVKEKQKIIVQLKQVIANFE